VYSAGFSTTVLPSAIAGATFQAQHQQRKVPRDDLAADAERLPVGQLGLHQLRPAGMVVEMAGDERNVDVAALADRLAVVQRFQHGEQPAVALHQAGERVEIAGAAMTGERRPCRLRPGGGLHRGIDVGGIGLRDARQHLAGGGSDRLEACA